MVTKTTKRRNVKPHVQQANTLKGRVKTDFMKLVDEFPLVEITSETQLKNAEVVLESLLDRDKLSAAEEQYLNVLAILIERYEDEHYPIGASTDADVLKFFMEDRGINQADLHRETGIPKSTISEILSGKRPFAKSVIVKLSDYFGVPKDIFMQNL